MLPLDEVSLTAWLEFPRDTERIQAYLSRLWFKANAAANKMLLLKSPLDTVFVSQWNPETFEAGRVTLKQEAATPSQSEEQYVFAAFNGLRLDLSINRRPKEFSKNDRGVGFYLSGRRDAHVFLPPIDLSSDRSEKSAGFSVEYDVREDAFQVIYGAHAEVLMEHGTGEVTSVLDLKGSQVVAAVVPPRIKGDQAPIEILQAVTVKRRLLVFPYGKSVWLDAGDLREIRGTDGLPMYEFRFPEEGSEFERLFPK